MYIAVALLVAPVAYHIVTHLVPITRVGRAEHYCESHVLGCDLTTHVLGDVVVAVVLYAWFLTLQSRASTAWRRRAMREPDKLFTWLTPVAGGLTEIAAETAADGGRRRLPAHVSSVRLQKSSRPR